MYHPIYHKWVVQMRLNWYKPSKYRVFFVVLPTCPETCHACAGPCPWHHWGFTPSPQRGFGIPELQRWLNYGSYPLGNQPGWWFGTFFIFPYIGNNHPNWLIFFRGVQTTNQQQFANLNMASYSSLIYPWTWCYMEQFTRGYLDVFGNYTHDDIPIRNPHM